MTLNAMTQSGFRLFLQIAGCGPDNGLGLYAVGDQSALDNLLKHKIATVENDRVYLTPSGYEILSQHK